MNIKWVLTVAAVMLFFISGFAKSEPEVLWTHSGVNPAIHPNGNVLLRGNNEVLEIHGLTGELVRIIPIIVSGEFTDVILISQDGTRFIAQGCLVDYVTGEILKQDICSCYWPFSSFLHPYNDKIIYAKNGFTLAVLDLGDNSESEFMIWPNTKFSITAIAVSNDGRFFAMSGRDFEDEYNTYIDLFDAMTIKPLSQLEKTKGEGNKTIDLIRFSENAKYVGYRTNGGTPKATFFECEAPYKKWEFENKQEPLLGYNSLEFIKDEYAFLGCTSAEESKRNAVIYDIKSGKNIYFTDKYYSSRPKYNKKYNSLLIPRIIITAIDLNKILGEVSVKEFSENETSFSVEYQKGKLILSGLNFISGNSGVKIFNLQGKLIFSLSLIRVQPDKTEIPLILKSGIYIVNINEGIKEYSQKFMVTE